MEKELSKVASELDLNLPGLKRILGSVQVTRGTPPQQYEIGLRLIAGELSEPVLMLLRRSNDLLKKAVSEYKSCCPRSVLWIARGDFDPNDQISEHSPNLADVKHACRSVGRIRAAILREFKKNNVVIGL